MMIRRRFDRYATRLAIVVAMSLSMGLLIGPAKAAPTTAVGYCNASNVTDVDAYVPPEYRYYMFMQDIGSTDLDIYCGNGKTWGAVHVEVKHTVGNWDYASTCISKIFNRDDTPVPTENGKLKKILKWNSGREWAILIYTSQDVVTAYHRDNTTWYECSRQ